ncbi:MAG: DUF4105 domain-containing protein [Pseudomonadota bacterium]
MGFTLKHLKSVIGGLVAMVLAFTEGAYADPLFNDVAFSETWLKLGRWEAQPLRGGYRSNIVTEEFFLAETGSVDPRAELRASMNAMVGPLGGSPDQHAVCQYPARAIFIEQNFALGLPDPFEACPELRTWSHDGEIRGVSALFIAGYFSNPGSAFGHILLRLHTDDETLVVEDVLDTAINYGARSSEDDPMIPYIIKGLTGQYRSTYTSLDFYHHSERFRSEQLRDIWQYRLNLTEDEVRLLTAHIWELLRAKNRYYFLEQNCAYRVGELLELVADRSLTPAAKKWMTPVDLFHRLSDTPDGDDPAISRVSRLASKETQFTDGYRALARPQQRLVDDLISPDAIDLSGASVAVGDAASAYNVALDYFAFNQDLPHADDRQAKILAARFALPPGEGVTIEPPNPPHEGQRSSLFSIAALSNNELGLGTEVRLRPAYFDFLSRTEGTQPYSELSMADIRLILRDDTIHLRSLEAVRVSGLGISEDGGPDTNSRAWRVRIGAETKDLSCDDCLLGFVETGLGEAVEVRPGIALFALASARIEGGDQINDSLSGVATAGAIVRRKNFGILLEGGVQQGLIDTDETLPFGKAEFRLHTADQWSVSFTSQVRRSTELGAAIQYYW